MTGIPQNFVSLNMYVTVNVCTSSLLFFCSILLTTCCKLTFLEAALVACVDSRHELESTSVQGTNSRKQIQSIVRNGFEKQFTEKVNS